MTHFEIISFYFVLNALIFVWLTLRVVAIRRRERISLGDADNSDLRKRIRSQGNFTETFPIAFIGLILVAMIGASSWILHLFGIGLTLGRALHAHGMMQKGAIGAGRPAGMVTTLLVLIGELVYLMYKILVG